MVLSIGSMWYLWKRDPVMDNMCHAVAALGMLFTTLALATGMIWGKLRGIRGGPGMRADFLYRHAVHADWLYDAPHVYG